MEEKNELLIKYGQAVEYLPPRLRHTAMSKSDAEKKRAEEFRLRAGGAFSILCGGVEIFQEKCVKVRCEELQTVLELATKSSVHTVQSALKDGYITVSGGHRIGVCGTAIRNGGGICGIREESV
ncbi:MAG: hypothetical protein IKU65_05185 [Oscillospiraceae bacterium]|nr:hypothetical protein [Oscillospiraceae bacterium]